MRGHWCGQHRGPLFGLAPRQVFLAPSLALWAVGSYPAVSPLPPTLRPAAVYVFCGTICQPRLSPRLPACISGLTGVTWACALWSSDFPPAACATSDPPLFQDRTHANRGSRRGKGCREIERGHRAQDAGARWICGPDRLPAGDRPDSEPSVRLPRRPCHRPVSATTTVGGASVAGLGSASVKPTQTNASQVQDPTTQVRASGR